MNGQRVVKIFNHEKKSEEEFDKLNEELFIQRLQRQQLCQHDGAGNRKYRAPAVRADGSSGRLPLHQRSRGITLGVMASYLQFTKSCSPSCRWPSSSLCDRLAHQREL